jgi:hypothetical protein
MSIREYVDTLFADYKDSASMQDFKEELAGNLEDRVAVLRKKGLDEETATKKALDELGDISVIAEEMSLKKKKEVYSEMYMGTRKYLTPKRTGLFILGGAGICFGLIAAAIVWFASEDAVATFATSAVFVALGAGLLTFMGVTQETGAKNPMRWKRAVFYAASIAVFSFGILAMPIVYFATTGVSPAELAAGGWAFSPENLGFTSAIAAMVPLVLPSIALFVYLILTEKDRSKPWKIDMREKELKNEQNRFVSVREKERYGFYSAAIWIAASSIFVLLIFMGAIMYSWLSMVAAVVGEMLLRAKFTKKQD